METGGGKPVKPDVINPNPTRESRSKPSDSAPASVPSQSESPETIDMDAEVISSAPRSAPPPKKNSKAPVKRVGSEGAPASKTRRTIPVADETTSVSFGDTETVEKLYTYTLSEFDILLQAREKAYLYTAKPQPDEMKSRDDQFMHVWSKLEKKTPTTAKLALGIQEKQRETYFKKIPVSIATASDEITLIRTVLLADAKKYGVARIQRTETKKDGATIVSTSGYKIDGVIINVLLDRVYFLVDEISRLEAENKLGDERLAQLNAEHKQKKRDAANRKAALIEAEQKAAIEEEARAATSLDIKVDGITSELAVLRADEESVRAQDEAQRLEEEAARAVGEKARLEKDAHAQEAEEDRLRKEDEGRVAEKNIQARKQNAINSANAAAETKRMEEEEIKRIFDEGARANEAKDEAERKRAALDEEQQKNTANIADIAQKVQESEDARIAADEKTKEESELDHSLEENAKLALQIEEDVRAEDDRIRKEDEGRVAEKKLRVQKQNAIDSATADADKKKMADEENKRTVGEEARVKGANDETERKRNVLEEAKKKNAANILDLARKIKESRAARIAADTKAKEKIAIVHRLEEEAKRAAGDKLRLAEEARVQNEDRRRKEEEEDRVAEENLRAQQKAANAETKRLENEETNRIAYDDARAKEVKEKAERKRAALVKEQMKNDAKIVAIDQKTKKNNEALIAAKKKAKEKKRAFQAAQDSDKDAKESLKNASKTRDDITLDRIAMEETELERLEEVYNLRVLTEKVVKLATFFVEDAGNDVAYGKQLSAILIETSAEINKATAEKKTPKSTSLRFQYLMGYLTGQFVNFAIFITEDKNSTADYSKNRSLEQKMHPFKVDILKALVFILSIEREDIAEVSGDSYDALPAQVVSISDTVTNGDFRAKRDSDASDAETLIGFARMFRDIAKHYVNSARLLLSKKQTSVTQARGELKKRQDKRAIGHEQARLAMMDRRYLAPLHPRDRPNYVPVIVVVMGRLNGKNGHRIISEYRTMANKTISMFDRNHSRERNYGYTIHLGRQAPVRVITKTETTGPIKAGSYLLVVRVERENIAMGFGIGSGILRLPDNNAESLFRHGEARILSAGAEGKPNPRAGVSEIFVRLSGKPTADGILPIKSILFHRWSISLPDEENIDQVTEAVFSMPRANKKGEIVNVSKQTDAPSGDENDSVESGGEDASASDSDGEMPRSPPLTSSASSTTKGTTSSSGPVPLAPRANIQKRSASPPLGAPPKATSAAGPLPLAPSPPPPPPVVQETPDISSKPKKTSAPSSTTKETTPSSGPRPLAPPKSFSPATAPRRSPSPPPGAPPSATSAAAPRPLAPPPSPPVVQETPDISSNPKKTSAPSTDILSYDINSWGSW